MCSTFSKCESNLLEESGSSLEKEETLRDTILNFRSMGIRVFVIRCRDEKQLAELQNLSGLKSLMVETERESTPLKHFWI